ncbi:MAG: hypothetical protein MMC23_009005 [Stictis urceolatum]|nr:hypothetical protein [Stictis urceolata]
MLSSMHLSFLLSLFAIFSLVSAHSVIKYPGWRGDNLKTTGNVSDTHGLGEFTTDNGTTLFPYGMQWMYPCGGMPLSENRTKWPITGGAVSFQPGWFSGHYNARLYINLGEGNMPPNMSLPIMPEIGIIGPTNDAYPDSEVCFPQLPLPAHYNASIGDNATIQVIMLAQHGAALFSCVDITFADPKDVAEVNKSNCQNSTDIQFVNVFTTTSLTNDASPRSPISVLSSVPLIAAMVYALL